MWKKRMILFTLAAYIIVMAVFTVVSGFAPNDSLPVVVISAATENEVIDAGAVCYDEEGHPFVYWVVPTETILGTGYKLKAWPVTIEEESNGKVKASGVRLIGNVVIACDQEMQDGMYVRLQDQ